MGIEELFDDIRALSPGQQAEVIDLVKYLRSRSEEARLEASAHAMMDAMMADPVQREALVESVRQGLEEHARGESLDMEEVFDDLLSGLPE